MAMPALPVMLIVTKVGPYPYYMMLIGGAFNLLMILIEIKAMGKMYSWFEILSRKLYVKAIYL